MGWQMLRKTITIGSGAVETAMPPDAALNRNKGLERQPDLPEWDKPVWEV